jgi:pyridoxamine 5'-phosphate oxidase
MELLPDPIEQFRIWYSEAENVSAGADVVALATASKDAVPSVRMVNFKGWYTDDRGECLSFFSNYESRKGRELDENPQAAMLFYWPELKRQVQVAGRCARLSRLESERYFRTRDREARLTAHMSQQSRELDSFEIMDEQVELLRRQFADRPIPCPEYWGGTLIYPERIEFRLSREHRRHYRWEFERSRDGWRQRRLFP